MLIAVDNNVLLDFADKRGDVIEAMEVIKRRLPGATVIVPPTVMVELGGPYNSLRREQLSEIAMDNLIEPWGFQPLDLDPVGHGIVERISRTILEKGVISDEYEIHDASIIAEAALLGCTLLITSDREIVDAINSHRETLWEILRDADVTFPKLSIVSPRTLAKYYSP